MASHDKTNDPHLAQRATDTEADEIRAADLEMPPSASGTNEESGLEEVGERIKADELEQPASASGSNDSGLDTEATLIRADQIDQDPSVEGNTNVDDGLAPEAERIRSHRIEEAN